MNSRYDYDIGDYKSGLVQHIGHPLILSRCIELLRELEEEIGQRGFDRENDARILDQLYVDDEHPYQTVRSEYYVWLDTAESTEEERQQNGYSTPEECVKYVLDAIKSEIKRLETHSRVQKKVNSSRIFLDKRRGLVPTDPQELERLLRYAASIDREIDRTFSQLERLQRMRLGHLLLPAIKLDVST